MKYFTMEELDFIAKELLDNPSKETLKKLNDKYNGESENTNTLNWQEAPKVENLQPNNNISDKEDINNENAIPNLNIPINENNSSELISPITSIEETPILNVNSPQSQNSFEPLNSIIPNLSIQNTVPNNNNFEISKIDNTQNINGIPSLELPNPEPISSNSNQELFNVNLWENSNNGINTMMQTTDNFNVPIDNSPNNNMIGGNTLFNQEQNLVNNPIPIKESPKYEGPTMFGQFEQNFNNNNAA